MKNTRFKIANLSFKNRLFLAPMVEVTDLPYRLVCREAGAAMAYTEMINIGAILHENVKTQNMMKSDKGDSPLGIQITGNNLKELKSASAHFRPFSLVDINCGCPATRIIGNTSGAYLLKTPKKIASMTRLLKDEGFVVSAKVRLGYFKNNVTRIAKAVEGAGADAITIHPRLAVQGYNIKADLKWIKKIKPLLGIPVIGNGDIFSGPSAEAMLEIADGAMIGRAAIGDPLIFKRALHYLKTGRELQPSLKENILCFKKYLGYTKKYFPEDLQRAKFVGCNFLKGFEGASTLRGKFMQLKSIDEAKKFVDEISRSERKYSSLLKRV